MLAPFLLAGEDWGEAVEAPHEMAAVVMPLSFRQAAYLQRTKRSHKSSRTAASPARLALMALEPVDGVAHRRIAGA